MSEYVTHRLGDVLERVIDHRGRTPKKLGGDFVPDGVQVLSANNVNDGRLILSESPRFVSPEMHDRWMPNKLKSGDVLLTSEAPLGEAAFLSDSAHYCLGQRLFALRVNPRIVSPRYLYYALVSPIMQGRLHGRATGTTAQGIRQTELLKVQVDLPPLERQEEIAHILGTLDDKIELNRQMNHTLEQIAATLFKSWFVDFDPVRAKAAGRPPEGMDAQTAALFPDRLVESEIGEIPGGWREVEVSAVAHVNSWTLGKNDSLDTIEYIDISSVSQGDIKELQVFQRGDEPSRARRRLRNGDTVLSTVRPDRGAYFLSLNPAPSLIASTGFAVVSPQSVPWSFLHSALTRHEVSIYLGHMADGAAYPAVRPDVIENLPLVLPDDGLLLDVFHSICGPVFRRAALNRQESRTLAELRDLLLPRLLSGDLRVPPVLSVVELAVSVQEADDRLVQSAF